MEPRSQQPGRLRIFSGPSLDNRTLPAPIVRPLAGGLENVVSKLSALSPPMDDRLAPPNQSTIPLQFPSSPPHLASPSTLPTPPPLAMAQVSLGNSCNFTININHYYGDGINCRSNDDNYADNDNRNDKDIEHGGITTVTVDVKKWEQKVDVHSPERRRSIKESDVGFSFEPTSSQLSPGPWEPSIEFPSQAEVYPDAWDAGPPHTNHTTADADLAWITYSEAEASFSLFV
ncbi:hypothetical protein BGX28_007051 [Mortierella sp. GBA30]|nr:hypothetical protein BGX28_007051 [Mortierella sp. GBA30]